MSTEDQETMTSRTMLVAARRQAHTVAGLGVRCDAKEIPEFASEAKPTGWWLAETCGYDGRATRGSALDEQASSDVVTMSGTAAMAVGEGRIIGVMSPDDTAEQALWWAWPLKAIQIATAGSRGMLRKRPTEITITGSHGALRLAAIARLYRHSGSAQGGQERSLLNALGG